MTVLKAPLELRSTLATMKSAKEKGVNMNIWDNDIKAVEEAIETIEALRATPAQGKKSCGCDPPLGSLCARCRSEAPQCIHGVLLTSECSTCETDYGSHRATFVTNHAERAPIGLADIERIIVDYFDAAGFEVVEDNGEWIAHVDDAEVFVTAIAVAIHSSIGRQYPAVADNELRSLIGRISDYFHVNAKPTDDLAIGYMNELDKLIVSWPSQPVSDSAVFTKRLNEANAEIKRLADLDIMHEAAQKLLAAERDALLDQVEELKACLHDFVFKEAVCDQTVERSKRALSSTEEKSA